MRNLHLMIGGLTAGLVSSSPVFAADLSNMTAQQPIAYSDAGMATATDNWTGFYAGAHVGGAIGALSSDDFEFDGDKTALTGGVQAGYLQQFGMWVVGAEATASVSDELTYELAPNAGLKENWAVAAKLRGGVALGDTLIYNVVGAQFAELEGTGAVTSGADTYAGVVFGAGVEQNLGNNFSVRAEYLQTRYFDAESSIAGVGRTDDLVNHEVTLGVNYRF